MSSFLVCCAVFLQGGLSSLIFDSKSFLISLSLFTFLVVVTILGFSSSPGGTIGSGGWCWVWLGGGGGGCLCWVGAGCSTCGFGKGGGGSAVMTLLGIFNPAQCATLRRVVPGGTIFVPPYLIFTLCQPCASHKLLGNPLMSSPGIVAGCEVGAAGVGWLLVDVVVVVWWLIWLW